MEDKDFTQQEIDEILSTTPKQNAEIARKFGCTKGSITAMRKHLGQVRPNGQAKIAAKPATVRHAPRVVELEDVLPDPSRHMITILSKAGMMNLYADELDIISVDRQGNVSLR